MLTYSAEYDGYCRYEMRLRLPDGGVTRAVVYDRSGAAIYAEPGWRLRISAYCRAADTRYGEDYDYYNSKYRKEYDENRKSQIGTGDRSERIRTYNFPQGRVTDHRIGFTLYSLENFLSGDIDEMIEALAIKDREAKLANEEDCI